MKKLKNIILTEEDLRDIISKNIVSERSFYRYSGPRSTSFSGGDDKACSLASVVTSKLEDEAESIKARIAVDAGEDTAVGESWAEKVNWVGPIQRSEVVRAGDTASRPRDADVWRLSFGWKHRDGTENNLILGYLPQAAEIEIMDTDAETLDDAPVRIAPASTVSGNTQQFALYNSKDDMRTVDGPAININKETGALIGDPDVWYKNIMPIVADWLARWAANDAACDQVERRRSRSRRSASSSSGGGVTSRGALTSSSWWEGSSRSGEPVDSYGDVEDSDKRVLIIAKMPLGIRSTLIDKIPDLRNMEIHNVGSGKYGFIIPGTRGVMQANRTFAGTAAANWGDNRDLITNWQAASQAFGRAALNRGRGNQNIKVFLDILSLIARQDEASSPNIEIIM